MVSQSILRLLLSQRDGDLVAGGKIHRPPFSLHGLTRHGHTAHVEHRRLGVDAEVRLAILAVAKQTISPGVEHGLLPAIRAGETHRAQGLTIPRTGHILRVKRVVVNAEAARARREILNLEAGTPEVGLLERGVNLEIEKSYGAPLLQSERMSGHAVHCLNSRDTVTLIIDMPETLRGLAVDQEYGD